MHSGVFVGMINQLAAVACSCNSVCNIVVVGVVVVVIIIININFVGGVVDGRVK